MSRPSKKGLTKTQVMVAIAALGLDENGFRRTQKQVSDLLAMSKSTVSEAIRRLIDGQYLMESGKASRDKLYARGINFAALEAQINDSVLENMSNLRMVQRTRVSGSQPDRSEVPEAPQNVNATEPDTWFEIHTSGPGYMFGVEKEGNIERTPIEITDPRTGRSKQVWQSLMTHAFEPDGSANWTGGFVLGDGRRYTLRYQRTVNGIRRFYVIPQHEVTVSPEVAGDHEACLRAFVAACTPMLNWLQKYAGWRFTTDECGMYALLNDIKPQNVHKALRGHINDVVTELTGGAFVGNDRLWADNSPGYTELETNQADYIEALIAMPETRRRVDAMFSEWPVNRESLSSLLEQVDTLARIVHRMYEIQCDFAQITAVSQRHSALAANQTTFDQYPMDGGSSNPSSGKPPEGYQ